MKRLSHLHQGRVRMVSVGDKPITERRAVATAFIRMNPETAGLVKHRKIGKGDVLAAAKIAGIQAAKRTSELIPLCHPVSLSFVDVAFDFSANPSGMRVEATATATSKTGVEMEALTAVTVAALTLYDMCKSVERGMTIEGVRLQHKSGGRSGVWNRR